MHQSRVLWVALVFGTSLLGACADTDEEGVLAPEEVSENSEMPVTLDQGLDSEERAFLTLINNHRASAGAPPLQVSVTLTRAADLHSVDMANRNYFSHTSQDGKSPFTRMTEAGYNFSTGKAENIAAGNETAARTFDQWKNSAGHNHNMLDPSYRVIGIGRAFNSGSQFKWYWTNTFGGHVDEVMTAAGTGTTTPPSGGTTTPPPSSGATETEPNNTFSAPNPVDGAITGTLTASDQDWFSWSIPAANIAYRIQLTAQGDAQLRMWKLVNGGFRQIANTTPTSFANTSTGAGQYVIAVFSASGAQQPYTLTVQK
jgi:uncharacterized protein YkwD